MMSISPPASGGGENITAADCTSSTRNMKNRQRSASDRVRSSRRNRENSVTLRRERRERFGIGGTPSFRIILYRCPRIGPSPPGWYYVLKRDLTFNMVLRDGTIPSTEESKKSFRNKILDNFRFTAFWNVGDEQKTQISILRAMESYVQITEDNDNLTLTVAGVWKYNLDGSLITYKVDQLPESEGGTTPGRLPLENMGEDYLAISYDNTKVPNFGSIEDALYSGGTLKLTLTGSTEYKAYKVWMDSGTEEAIKARPGGTFQLWRYRKGQDFDTASPLRNALGTLVEVKVDTDPQPDETGVARQHISFAVDFDGDGKADDSLLPKYDPEGYEYIYCVKEVTQSRADSNHYKQVFGEVQDDDTLLDRIEVNGSIVEDTEGKRPAGNAYLYNGGTLSNCIDANITTRVTKTWDAASFQSELEDVRVELKLQSRPKDSYEPWEDTSLPTVTMDEFYSEQLTQISSQSVPQYDMLGRELEYRWVECGVYQGESEENLLRDDGTFTLRQNGYSVNYQSSPVQQDGSSTLITNTLDNSLDYLVAKDWQDEQGQPMQAPAGETVTLQIFQGLPGEPLDPDPYVEITLDGAADPAPTVVNADLGITVQETEPWKGEVRNLPEFDSSGRQYEYYLLEEGDGVSRFPIYETERTEDGGYQTRVINVPRGAGNRIMVRKVWIDDSDTTHRLPVTIQAYAKEDNKAISSVTLRDGVWYGYIGIGSSYTADEVYILETQVGDEPVPLTTYYLDSGASPNYTQPEAPAEYDPDGTYTAIQYETEYHRYEAAYSRDTIAGTEFLTVTNRRLGNINLTVTKQWLDGEGSVRKELLAELKKTWANSDPASQLYLAIRLDLVGGEDYYKITRNGPDTADTITVGNPDNQVAILDQNGNPASSLQIVSLEPGDSTREYAFHNLPKYDRSGQVVHYTAVEVWVDGSGRELSRTELAQKFPDAYALIRSYSTGYSDEKYLVGELHDSDSQTMTVTNRLSGTKSVLWHKQWKDTYNYENGLRPDIYLDIYQVTHVRGNQGNPTTQVSLYQANYHWTYLQDDVWNGDQLLSPIYHWHAVFSSLPKYDSLGYEIYYYAVENTHVNASDFDYEDTALAYPFGGANTTPSRIGTQSGMDNGIPQNGEGVDTAVLIPDGLADAGKYALLEDGTFTNTASANVTVLGQKLWKTMPASYPAADLPEVTFTLQQTLGTETKDIATLTIQNWKLPLENGAYHFGFAYTGENVVSSENGALVIAPASDDSAQPLPKYNADGERYTYTLQETSITLKNRTGSKLVYLDPVINTYLVENGYRSIQGALSVKKFLQLPTDEDGKPTAYPAVQFTLDRRYTQNNGDPSVWEEDVQTVTWTSKEVEEAYKDNTLLEQVLTFENLDYYAPNGSRWEYRIREVTDGWLGGYKITAVAGNADSTDVINTIYKAEGILVGKEGAADLTLNKDEGRGGTADNVAVAASFYNKPDDTRETVTLEFDKVWDDFGDAFRTRPDELTLTVLRQAHSQEGQDNAILPPQTVDPSLYTISMTKDPDGNTWHYTITGKVDGELERYAPNGMPWVYGIQEVKPSGYESASGGETWTTGDPDENGVLTAGDLTNSITQTVYYRKQWLNSDGSTVTEDYLGTEITVTFQLQVRNATGSKWENAETFFQNALSAEDYAKLFGSYDFTPELTGRINDGTVWNKNHALINLPRFISDGRGGTTQLSYRVVETGISWDGGSPINVTVTKDSKDSWKYKFSRSGLFSPVQGTSFLPSDSTFIIQNQLNTTSITVRKEWDGDQGNAYGTRPTTGRDDYNWEVSLLVQYSTDDANWKTLTTYEKAADDTFQPHPVILHVYGVNEQDVSTANATLSGLPAYDLKGNPLTYRVRELQPKVGDDTWWYSEVHEITVADAEAAIVGENRTFHHNYTANYTDDTLVAENTYGSVLRFTAEKKWHGTPAASLPLELQYLAVENGKKVWKSFPTPATVELDGTAGPNPTDPYYENTPADSAVWTAVWEKVPTVMPGSVTDDDGKTRYRIAETVPGGYQTVNGSPTWQEVTADNPEATFTNVKSTSLTVEKKWGTSLAATSLPASITVQLYSSTNPEDAEKGNTADRLKVEGKTLILRNPNPASANWTGSFTNLPLYTADGDPIYYYAKEIQIAGKDLVKAADGCYLVTIGSKEHHFRFSFDTTTTGSYKTTLVNVEYSDITGTKSWKDNSNAYGTRPDGITLALYRKAGTGAEEVVNGADGKPLQPTWVKSGNTWTYTYTHLPEADDQGAVYTYRVEEIQTTGPAGGDQYTVTQNGMNLTNTLTGTVNLQVEKLWQDNDNALGLRPDEIIVELCVNGSPDPTRTLTLTAANDWKGSFDGLAKYDSNGALIRYSVREESQSMPLGYRVYYGEAVTGTPESSEEPVYQFTNVADGAVTLTKKVSGSRGDTSKAFTFTFTLTSGLPSTAPADAYPYTITRQDGTQETGVIRSGETFTLRHNESITISELPGNAAYQFTESDNTGYQVSSTGASGTVLPGSTISASFENYRGGGGGGGHDPDPDPDPRHDHPTPSPDPELPYTGQDWRTVGLLSAGGVILLSLGLFRRRKDHEPSQPE